MQWYHKLLIVLCAIAMLIMILFFGLKIDHVNVEGTEIYSAEEIKKSVFSRPNSDNELIFAFYQKMYGINKLPFVEDIEVTFVNRNTVTLHVYDKTISGCIKYMGQFVYFDKYFDVYIKGYGIASNIQDTRRSNNGILASGIINNGDKYGKFKWSNNNAKLKCVSYFDGTKMSNFTKYRIINYFSAWLLENDYLSKEVSVTFESL